VISKNWKIIFPKKEKKNYSNLIFKKIISKNFPNKFLVEKNPTKFVTKKKNLLRSTKHTHVSHVIHCHLVIMPCVSKRYTQSSRMSGMGAGHW
jgi:hypothetical protein